VELGLLAHRDLAVTQASPVLQDSLAELDLLEPQDLGETRASWEVRVFRVSRVRLVILDSRVLLDCRVRRVELVSRDRKEHVDSLGLQARLGSPELQARLESPDHKDLPVREVLTVHLVLLDLWAWPVTLDWPALQEPLVAQVLLGLREHRA